MFDRVHHCTITAGQHAFLMETKLLFTFSLCKVSQISQNFYSTKIKFALVFYSVDQKKPNKN